MEQASGARTCPSRGAAGLSSCGSSHNSGGPWERFLPQSEAQRLGLAEYDFWLFDSRAVGILQFDGDRSLGMTATEDRLDVLKGCQIRDAALHFAIPAMEFTAQVPSVE